MAKVLVSNQNNIKSPEGNSLALFIEGVTNIMKVKDVLGNVQPITECFQGEALNPFDYIQYSEEPTDIPSSIGTTYWDSFYKTIALIDGIGNTTLQVGQEERVLVHNNTGSDISDGQVVYISGSTGELPRIALANANSELASSKTIGVVTELIPQGGDGFVTITGMVHGLNTLAYTAGDLLWLSTTSGQFTNTKPTSPNHRVLIGYVIKKAGGNGSILVKIQNTQDLVDCSDVLFSALVNNNIMTYDFSTSLWKNKSLASIISANSAPATASSAGIAGDIRYDANYMYVCVATNTWKRTALSTW